jgi:hypothetical protein
MMTISLHTPSLWLINTNGSLGQLILDEVDDQGYVSGSFGGTPIVDAWWDETLRQLTFSSPLAGGGVTTFAGFLFDDPEGHGLRFGGANDTAEFAYGIAGTFEGPSSLVSGWFAGGAGGPIVFESRSSGMVLDVRGASFQDGAAIQQYPWNGGINQQWTLLPTNDGNYTILSGNIIGLGNGSSDLVMDVTGASTEDGALIQLYHANGGSNQEWTLEPTDPGFHRIVSASSGMVLDVPGASTDAGVQVQQYHINGGWNQDWKVTVFLGLSSGLSEKSRE